VTVVRRDVSLRAYEDRDLGLLRALLGDSEMTRFLGGPESDDALLSRHARYLSADPATNAIFTIVVDGLAAGWVGLWESEWEGEMTWECGWSVLPDFQRAGVARAAAHLALDDAAERGRHRVVDAFPSVDNVASNALCSRLGFTSLGEVDVEYPKGRMMRAVHWRFDLEAPPTEVACT